MVPIVALLVSLAAPAGRGAVEARITTLRLDVLGSAGCISRNDVASRIMARSARIRLADDAPVTATLNVTSQRQGAVLADLTLTAAGPDGVPRHVVARSCPEAADAAALIIVVALDPTTPGNPANGSRPASVTRAAPPRTAPASAAANEPRPSSAAPSPAAVAAPLPPSDSVPRADGPTTSAAPPTSAPPLPQKPSIPAVVASPQLAVEAPPPAAGEARPPAHAPGSGNREGTGPQLGGSLSGQMLFGPAPHALMGLALSISVASQREGPWAPALFVGWTHAERSGFSAPGGVAAFTLNAASVDACPVRWDWSQVSLRPCLAFLLGSLASRGAQTENPGGAARPFGAAGLGLAVAFGQTLQLSARLGLGLTLIRDSYAFDSAFFQAGRFTTSASLGLGARWH